MYDCETCNGKHWSLRSYAKCHPMTSREIESLAVRCAGEDSGALLASMWWDGSYVGNCSAGATPREWARA